jgi:hypothetical protein
MSRFIAEGRAVVEAFNRYQRVFQIGTFGRFGMSRNKAEVRKHKIMSSGLLFLRILTGSSACDSAPHPPRSHCSTMSRAGLGWHSSSFKWRCHPGPSAGISVGSTQPFCANNS